MATWAAFGGSQSTPRAEQLRRGRHRRLLPTALKAFGAEARLGDLEDLDGLREAASAADGVIHLAFKHDAMRAGDYAGAVDDDLAAVRAFGEALAGTGKPFVGTSG